MAGAHRRFFGRGSARVLGFACVVLALPLAACQQTGGAGPEAAPAGQPQGTGVSPVTPSTFRLPEGSGCSGEIARFRAVMDNDLATGHVNRSVYDRIIGELNGASSQCAAGNSGGALASLRATKSRHGYP
jgi:hypothetical protein